MYSSKFEKFGGDKIPNILDYLRECIINEPTSTISVGCDSINAHNNTIYVITVMIYNTDVRRGAHVVYFRDVYPIIRDTQQRLYKEALYLHDVGNFLNDGLESFYFRNDLCDTEIRRYKYHLMKCNKEVGYIDLLNEDCFMNNIFITEHDRVDYKLVDLHIDFNPFSRDDDSNPHRSSIAYRNYVPWLRGIGFRVWAKPVASAASTAADLLVKIDRFIV